MAGKDRQSIDNVIEEILDYQVDGIIAASVSMSSGLSERCRSAGVPMVLFNRAQDEPDMSAVTSDNIEGGKKIAKYLIGSGHKKISYIAGWEGASTQRDRETGFTSILNEAGINLHSRRVGNFVIEESREATRSMFSDKPPDAVFVANDHMALAVMDTLRYELGLKIPDDVSIVGYDDVPAASWPSYLLTTVQQPVNIMVRETVEILIEKIDNANVRPQKIKIDGPLILRNSVKIQKGYT
jgi:DNA-binding LacI/PurR family transcriptional regulator